MHRRCTWATFAALIVIAHKALNAQTPAPPVRRWSLSTSYEIGGGKSNEAVEASMRAGGFADREGCAFFCSGTVANPHSRAGSPGGLLTVRWQFNKMVHFRAVLGRHTLAETFGFSAAGGFGGTNLAVNQSVTTVAILAGIHGRTTGGPWAAMGPAFFHVASEIVSGPNHPRATANRLGAVVVFGVTLPSSKRFFVDLQGQYRFAGTTSLGPMDVPSFQSGNAGTLPRTPVNFNHLAWGFGLGVRF